MSRAARLLALAVVMAGAFLRAASAQPAQDRLALAFDDCAAARATELRRAIAIELRATVVTPDARPTPMPQISIACRDGEDAGAYEVRVREGADNELVRSVDLSREPVDVRPRLLALSLADFVAMQWPSTPPPAAPAPVAAKPTVADVAAAATAPVARRHDLRVVALGRFLSGEALLAWGVGAGARTAVGPFVAGLGVAVERSATDLVGGRATVVLASVSPSVGLATRAAGWRWSAGLGASFGLARLSGAPSDEATEGAVLQRWWSAPYAYVEGDLDRRWPIVVRVEAGAVAAPVTGRSPEDHVRVGGAFVALQWGIGFGW
jgi:hypothetical protein